MEHLFCGRILQSVVCTECQASSDTYQTITALSLDIGQAGSVEQSLQQFAAVEVLVRGSWLQLPGVLAEGMVAWRHRLVGYSSEEDRAHN